MELRKLAEAFELALTEEIVEDTLDNLVLSELEAFGLDLIDTCDLQELASKIAEREDIALPEKEFSVEDFCITEHGYDVLKNAVISLINDEEHKEDMEYNQAEDNMLGYIDGVLSTEKDYITDCIKDDVDAFDFSPKALADFVEEY